jgi:thymidylate synthase (FAD)
MGDDITVVNAARVSFNKESEYVTRDVSAPTGHIPIFEGTLSVRDQKLIKYLASHNHFTPFTHCAITIREKVPIFVARQRFKHTVGFSYNEVSRRYVNDEPEFFEPEEWRYAPNNGAKQGSSGVIEGEDQLELFSMLNILHNSAKTIYTQLLENGVAPEQARMVLPQSMYTEYYVTGSLSAWARAYNLRIDSHAQKEIQMLAQQWDEIIRPLYPFSWAALTERK